MLAQIFVARLEQDDIIMENLVDLIGDFDSQLWQSTCGILSNSGISYVMKPSYYLSKSIHHSKFFRLHYV